MLPSDVGDLRPAGTLVAIEPTSCDGRYLGIDLVFEGSTTITLRQIVDGREVEEPVKIERNLHPIIGHVLACGRSVRADLAANDVVVFRPLTYTDVHFDDGRRFAFIDERAILAVVVNYENYADGAVPCIEPLGDRVVIAYENVAQTSAGGLALAESSLNPPEIGTVIAVGPGRRLASGHHVVMSCSVGDAVLYRKTAALELALEGRRYEIVAEKDVLAIC